MSQQTDKNGRFRSAGADATNSSSCAAQSVSAFQAPRLSPKSGFSWAARGPCVIIVARCEVTLDIPFIDNEDLYVIGDVHGCAEELELLLAKLPLQPQTGVVFVGDYIDRGPASRQVVDALLRLQCRIRVYPLLGNHETLLLDFMDDPSPLTRARFTYNGGGATLQSYSNAPGRFAIPDNHMGFYRSLRLAFQTRDHVFVHAGLPAVPIDALDEERDRETILWVRHNFHCSSFRWGKVIVHGHSRVPEVHRDERRINVDTGCVYKGKLTALHLPTGQVFQVARQTPEEHRFLRDEPQSRRRAVRFDGRVEVTFTEPRGLPLFHTINYNDFGLLVASSERPAQPLLHIGDEVAGTLLPQDDKVRAEFRGVVVRLDEIAAVVHYAIRFHAPAKAVE